MHAHLACHESARSPAHQERLGPAQERHNEPRRPVASQGESARPASAARSPPHETRGADRRVGPPLRENKKLRSSSGLEWLRCPEVRTSPHVQPRK